MTDTSPFPPNQSLATPPSAAHGVVRGHVVEAVKVMRPRLGEHWTLEALADEAHLSQSQLARCFDAVVGVSPMTYLKRLRTEQMARLLLTTDLTVGQISRTVGFSSSGFAARCFRQQYGVSPTEYRQQHATPTSQPDQKRSS